MDIQTARNSKTFRLWIIGILIVIAIAAFFFVKGTTAKVILGVVIALLTGALGLEVANTDYDLGKIVETGSIAAGKLERGADGAFTNVDSFCNAESMDYNCDDFKTQTEAQQVYNRCAELGKNMDVFRLDGDKDGKVCESLPVGAN